MFKDNLVVPVPPGYGTTVIAICFILLAYVLDPIVQTAYRRIRAFSAWKAIQNDQIIEVTDYPIVAEVLWGRGKLDTGRVVAFLVLLFSAASLALERQLDITNMNDGPVDVFDRPPPVMQRDSHGYNITEWEVLDRSDFNLEHEEPKGFLKNFKKRCEGKDGVIFEVGDSTSIYRIGNNADLIRGVAITSSWSSNVSDANYKLHYDIKKNGVRKLKNLQCGGKVDGITIDMYEGHTSKDRVGNVTQCDEGPDVYHHTNGSNRHPPTIILRTNNRQYLIVEENGGYPGFFYSVWNVNVVDDVEGWDEVAHVFFIESRFRLVEAIITGLVYGFEEAGKCVDLMMQYSAIYDGYDKYESETKTRAHPFGEHPESSQVKTLIEVEPIPLGLKTDAVGISSLALLGILSVVGIVSCLLVQSKIGMDIYDRDELIRTVTLPDQNTGEEQPSSMRMFVRKDETGRIDVVISDAGKAVDRCSRYFRRSDVMAHDEPAVATTVGENGSNAIPTGPRQMHLQGMRMGLGRTNFPRGFGPMLSLTSSAFPSASCTPVTGMTPARDRVRNITCTRGKIALCESSNTITGTDLTPGMCAGYPVKESSVTFNMKTGNLTPYDTLGVPRSPFGTKTSPATIGGPCHASQRSPKFPYMEGVTPFSRSRTNAAEDTSDSDTTFSTVGSEHV